MDPKRVKIIVIGIVLIILNICCKEYRPASLAIKDNIPNLDSIAGQWVSADTTAMEPSIRNFRGQALLNRDLVSISWLASAPYSGGYHTGLLRINGEVPEASMFRWLPYEALRKGKIQDFDVLSSTRMIPDENGVMWKVQITNKSNQTKRLNMELDMIGFISKYGGDWQWWYPYPKMDGKTTERDEEVEAIRKRIVSDAPEKKIWVEKLVDGKPTGEKNVATLPSDKDILQSKKYKTVLNDGKLFVFDSESEAITAFCLKNVPDSLITMASGGTGLWDISIKPGETKILQYCMAFGDNKEALNKKLDDYNDNFETRFAHVKEEWEKRWNEIFTPHNSLLSGTFPVLETDNVKAKRVYYTGPLTMLYLTNTHMPGQKKVFLTGGPRWGASTTFFWDITEWSSLFAVADPVMMKEQLISWIKIDPSKFYGLDNFGGKGVGNAYSANYWALFQLIHSYITITKDYDFLKEVINGKTILETMEAYATNWQKLSSYGNPGCADEIYKLADFGSDEWNLLECVPTYKHIVPSFNAGYIWMMRETAKFYKNANNVTKFNELNKQSDEMIPLLMKLYKGNGIWNSLYPGNKFVEVRHCLDFMFMGRYIPKDLSPAVKQEMLNFLDKELLTDHWMRAQSLQDIAAKNSDRPDHGPLGAFDGWPAGTMDALTQMGYSEKAFDFYRAVEPVTHEGVWSQAHELWGENKYNKNARTRIAERGWHNRESSAGIGFSQVMLKSFFGFYPEIGGEAIRNFSVPNFEGTLHHVLFGGKYYKITMKDGKRSFQEEEK